MFNICALYNRRKPVGTLDGALIEHQKQKENAQEEKAKDKAGPLTKSDICLCCMY
jgi:hypothetical protein